TPLTPTVDNLLLPGVIGTIVEGPKTPRRSSRVEPGSGTTTTLKHVNHRRSHGRMTPPPAYNDDHHHYDDDSDDDQFFPSASVRTFGRSKSETPKKDRIQHHHTQSFRTPQAHRVLGANEWRKKYHLHDSPNARAAAAAVVSAPTGLGNVARSPGRRTRQRSTADPYDHFTALQEAGEDSEEEHEQSEGEEFQHHHHHQHDQGLNLDGHDSKGTKAGHGHLHTADATDDDDGVHMADDSGLDVGSDQDGQRDELKEARRQRRQERARIRQLREEDREKNQLGFLRRLVNMFAPDDLGDDSLSNTDDDDLSSLTESEVDNSHLPPYHHHHPPTSSKRHHPSSSSSSASRRRVSGETTLPTNTTPSSQPPHRSAALRRLSSRGSAHSLGAHTPPTDEETKSDYADALTSDDDDGMRGDTSPHHMDYETQYRIEEDDAKDEALAAAQNESLYSQPRQYIHQYPSRDSPLAVPRVYPWHVIARMSRQQYQHVRAALSSLCVTVLDTALALWEGLVALLMALWATVLAVCGDLSVWLKEGVNSGLFSPRTLMSVGLLMLAIFVSNMLSSSGVVERSWDSLANAHRNPAGASRMSLDFSAMMTAVLERMNKNSLLNRKWSTPTPSTSWDSMENQNSPTGNSGSSMSDLKFQKQQTKRLEAIEARLLSIQQTLTQLNGADQELDKQLRAQLKDLASQISAVGTKVEHVIQDVNTLKHRLQSGVWLNQTVMEMIHDELPRYLVIAKNQTTGQLMVPAEFWQMAREMLVMADETSQALQEGSGDDEPGDHGARGGGEWRWLSDYSKKRQKSRQWASFLKDHEKALNELVDRRQAVVSRQSFLGLVRTEAASIWQAIEPQVLPWLERRGRLSPSFDPAAAATSAALGESKAGEAGYVGSILTQAEREAMSLLIDEALERYTADAIAKPDYALYSAGGRIIPKLTTRCEDLRWLGNVIALFMRPSSHKPPEYAIRPGTTPGECWALEGDHGQLGIRLARQIIPTEVTIEHADMRVVLDMGSAPKEFELWGIPSTEDASSRGGKGKDKLEEGQAAESDAGSKQVPETTTEEEAVDGEEAAEEESEAPWPGAFLLTRNTYQVNMSAVPAATGDASSPSSAPLSERESHLSHPRALQTFPIPLSKQHVPVMGVVLKIKSNWGHPEFTCLYRVRVHGYEP
ncbi:hypothetical protein BGZ73_002357, partial [Actinomortierella ambigua]